MCATPMPIKNRCGRRRRECSLLLHHNSSNNPAGFGKNGSSNDLYEFVKSADGTTVDIATNPLQDSFSDVSLPKVSGRICTDIYEFKGSNDVQSLVHTIETIQHAKFFTWAIMAMAVISIALWARILPCGVSKTQQLECHLFGHIVLDAAAR